MFEKLFPRRYVVVKKIMLEVWHIDPDALKMLCILIGAGLPGMSLQYLCSMHRGDVESERESLWGTGRRKWGWWVLVIYFFSPVRRVQNKSIVDSASEA